MYWGLPVCETLYMHDLQWFSELLYVLGPVLSQLCRQGRGVVSKSLAQGHRELEACFLWSTRSCDDGTSITASPLQPSRPEQL